MAQLHYRFEAEVWEHALPGGWHFVSLPKAMSREIRATLGHEEEGWGRLKVVAQFADLRWSTAIWFDTKHDTYLLPIKAEIRKKAKIYPGQRLALELGV